MRALILVALASLLLAAPAEAHSTRHHHHAAIHHAAKHHRAHQADAGCPDIYEDQTEAEQIAVMEAEPASCFPEVVELAPAQEAEIGALEAQG